MNKKPISSTSVSHSPHPPGPSKTPKKERKNETEVGCKYRCKKVSKAAPSTPSKYFAQVGWIRHLMSHVDMSVTLAVDWITQNICAIPPNSDSTNTATQEFGHVVNISHIPNGE